MSAHENMEHAEHAEHASHSNKKIALLISVLALFLAFSETLGKSAQTLGIELNIKSSDTWNFFQAKSIRQTTLRTAAEVMSAELPALANDDAKAAVGKQIDTWKKTVERYESEPSTGEGRKELMAKAQALEHQRDVAMARYHNYEYASAAYQIGIVLASAAVITGMMVLAFGSIGLGVVGLIFTGLGLFAPETLHDLSHWVEHIFAGSGAH
ncbi:MAG: hypothetical protein QOF19_3263 [Alphaproteobacteria bacterium]|jgi:hypothetical protein|nr:hypothetical protein [Alphaproteobacteria bacterium]